jgi:hypothetical protein
MTYQQKQILINRLKSFGWRAGAFVLVFVADELIPFLDLAPEIKTFLALVLGEITKALNSKAK